MKADPSRPLAAIENQRNVLVIEPVDAAEEKHFAMDHRERLECFVELLLQLLGGEPIERQWSVICRDRIRVVQQFVTLLPVTVDREVPPNPVQPREEGPAIGAIPLRMPPEAQEGLLHQILSSLVVTGPAGEK